MIRELNPFIILKKFLKYFYSTNYLRTAIIQFCFLITSFFFSFSNSAPIVYGRHQRGAEPKLTLCLVWQPQNPRTPKFELVFLGEFLGISMETGVYSESPTEPKKTKSKTARKPKEAVLKQSKSSILILIYFAYA